MATMTMKPTAIEPKIKAAMESIENMSLGERTNDLLDMLDEIALDAMLKESEEQDEKGLNISAKELKEEIEMEMRNGTYRIILSNENLN